ncbi:hypothetical protein TNCV_1480241 [Trichonephila clavipes]|nr:hypothetical protein TNCV_1480241 [Trichonephila clavipes]
MNLKLKLKLDDRGRLFPEGWEKKINHDVRLDLIKKTPTTKRGGRTYPKARTLYRSRAPAGRGEERPKAVNQGGAISPKNPE